MGIGKLRRECQTRVDALVSQRAIPDPFSVSRLCDRIAELRDRPLYVCPLPAPAVVERACGLWLAAEDADFVFVEQATTTLHHDHIVLHEIAHMLCAHTAHGQWADAAVTGLFPDLSPGMVGRIFARTNYTSHQEQEAEMVASLIRTAAETIALRASQGVRGTLEIALGIRR